MKVCPKCKTAHQKAGVFCSRSCANSRSFSADTNARKSLAAKTFMSSPSGQKQRQFLSDLQTVRMESVATRDKISRNIKAYWTPEKRLEQAIIAANQEQSPIKREKCRIAANARQLGGHTSKRKLYFKRNNGDEIYLQSSYEIKFAEILEKLNINWSRPAPFKWIDSLGVEHRYYPDFKVGEVYIDTKNSYLAEKDAEKISRVKEQNQIDLRIVLNENITEKYIGSLV